MMGEKEFMSPRLLVFAGTTEGRRFAEYLEERGIAADICVATEYGEALIDAGTYLHKIHTGRLGPDEMAALMENLSITHVVDATHPYAVEVSKNIKAAAQKTGGGYLRLLREDSQAEFYQVKDGQAPDATNDLAKMRKSKDDVSITTQRQNICNMEEAAAEMVEVGSVAEAVEYLKKHPGNVLAATGSKELHLYTEIEDYQNRVFARILSTKESMEIAAGCGFQGKNLICMQGPFSEELNIAMLKSVDAAYLVTKESGKTGGFPEKLRAARKAGATLIVVGRPPQEEGYSFRELTGLVEKLFDSSGGGSKRSETCLGHPEQTTEESMQLPVETTAEDEFSEVHKDTADFYKDVSAILEKRVVTLIGIGMGSADGMTLEAAQTIREADLLIGAQRMLDSARAVLREAPAASSANRERSKGIADGEGLEIISASHKPEYSAYLSGDIARYIREHREYNRICVLLSGDIGFYSGAKKLMEKLDEIEDVRVETTCGISSVVYLCGKLRTAWEDVKLVSIHGRNQNLINAVKRYPKVFALVGKKDTFAQMCRDLVAFGLGDVKVSAGSNLSYENEQIVSGMSAEQMLSGGFMPEDLCSVLIENKHPENIVTHGIEDEAFIRGKVPMTKSEVRSISLSKLSLHGDSVLYDIGAGTGSVSIEAARLVGDGMVYAIEKKSEAVELIRQNMLHFGVSNIAVIEGLAPEALADLPAPTHAFLGGTSGNMKAILELLLHKNPHVRVVINAIALETVGQTLQVLQELGIEDADIACVNISKSKTLGSYHMMMGQNPVYIISIGT